MFDSAQGIAAAAGAVVSALTAANAIYDHIVSLDLDDKEKRNLWTPRYVAEIFNTQPGYNVLLIYTKHRVDLRDVIYQGQVPFRLSTGFTINYMLYIFDSGTVDLEGDGGYLNWAFQGNFKRSGGHVEFYSLLR